MECEMVPDEYGEWVRYEDADMDVAQAYTNGENSGHADWIGELLDHIDEEKQWTPITCRKYIERQKEKGDVLAGANAVLKDRIKQLEGLCREWARWVAGFQHLGETGRDLLRRTHKSIRGEAQSDGE